MLFHADPLFCMYFGDKKTGFAPQRFYATHTYHELVQHAPFALANELMGLRRIITLKQIHSDQGFTLETEDKLSPYTHEGDYLITHLSGIGLGVATADCLPIVLYEPEAHIIGIAHAGWPGTLAGIATKMLADMCLQGARRECMQVFFGPSAKACCYEIQPDFTEKLNTRIAQKTLTRRESKFFFDIPQANRLQLEDAGIPAHAFHERYNLCTICTPAFCSYRREGAVAFRQMTIVALR